MSPRRQNPVLGLLVLATLTAVTWHVSHGASAAMQRAKVRAQQAAAHAVDLVDQDKLPARDRADTWHVVSHAAEHKPKMPISSPLPVEDTPWKALYAELAPRAAKGDKKAAVRLWHDTMRCVGHFEDKRKFGMLNDRLARGGLDADSQRFISDWLARVTQAIARNRWLCNDVAEPEIEEATYPTMLLAAEAGSEMAARCYVSATFPPGEKNLKDPAHMAEFRQHAMSLAQAGIARGDWTMVSLLAYAYSDNAGWGIDAPLISAWYRVDDRDPLKWYAYLKLEALGQEADGESAASAEDGLQELIEQHQLAPNDVIAADAWARELFVRYFAGRPYTGPRPGQWEMTICDPRG
jgi:hypothetical protein